MTEEDPVCKNLHQLSPMVLLLHKWKKKFEATGYAG